MNAKHIALVALLMLLVSPAFAYTPAWTGTYPGTSTGFSFDPAELRYVDKPTGNSLTFITRNGPTYYNGSQTGTYTGGIYYGYGPATQGSLIGNGSIAWSCAATKKNYDSMCDFEYTITDIGLPGSGSGNVRFGTWTGIGRTDAYSSICGSSDICYAKSGGSASVDPYSAVQTTGAGVANGTYNTFTGLNTTTPSTGNETPVRTYVRAIDGAGGAWITGANVAIKNEQTLMWTNATAAVDGSHYIDLLSNQTLAGYVSGTGYSGGSRVGLVAWDGVYEIPMYAIGTLLTPGVGEVSVVVDVKDQITKAKIVGAHVDYTKSTGETEGYSTSSSGTANFLAPNVSTINIKISKDGYTSVSKAITTTEFGPDYILVYLPKVQATPSVTATIPGDNNHDGVVDEKDSVPGVTPITTLDTRTDSQKDSDLMAILRNNAESILWLCILAIIFGLLKMIVKW